MPALVALAIGTVLGIVFLFRSRGSRPAPESAIEVELTLRDLEQERETLLAQLRELTDLAPGASRDRLELELQGARVLRAIDAIADGKAAKETARASASVAAAEPRQPVSPWISFAWGMASVFIVAGIGLFVANSATQKEGSAMQPAAQASGAPVAPDLAQLEAAVAANPDNVEMRLALARQYLMSEKLMEVYAHTDYILQRDPENPAALTYQSIVRWAMGERDAAQQMVEHALEHDPDFVDAYVQLALIHSSSGRPAEAASTMREAIARHPDQKQALESLLEQIQAQPGA
jgi:tetratricopeptide (TPR) repeat protein